MGDTLYLFKAGLFLASLLSAPVLIVVVLLGVLVSLLQAAFQLQDQTLPMLVKLLATILVLAATWTWMASQLIEYSNHIFERIEGISTRR